MRKKGFRNLGLGVTALLVTVLLLGNGVSSLAQSQAAPGGGPQEGIKVHGHWTIEVRNPDGTLVTRREFENALVPAGAGAIASLLAANVPGTNPALRVPTAWVVWVGNSVGAGTGSPCQRGTGGTSLTSCGMTNSIAAQGTSPNEFFPTLTAAVPASGPNAGRLVLQGTATATSPQPGVIDYVLTQLWTCPPTFSPVTACGTQAGQENMTQAVLVLGSQNPPVNVVSGQIIQVTVIISFS